MAKKYATAEERERAKLQRRSDKRAAIQDRLQSVVANKHVHMATINSTVTLEKELKGRIRSMLWRCNCGSVFDGEYWYKREDTDGD